MKTQTSFHSIIDAQAMGWFSSISFQFQFLANSVSSSAFSTCCALPLPKRGLGKPEREAGKNHVETGRARMHRYRTWLENGSLNLDGGRKTTTCKGSDDSRECSDLDGSFEDFVNIKGLNHFCFGSLTDLGFAPLQGVAHALEKMEVV
ncbi:hypothetical protein VNO78_16337 [Psophocarpus tetragonolobus]|uniref:Uncharacterized protein n=1 Tax=Psophocarpus tetragonolobus TaxID=3891 RepID=A0AAN9SL99_PSOTE